MCVICSNLGGGGYSSRSHVGECKCQAPHSQSVACYAIAAAINRISSPESFIGVNLKLGGLTSRHHILAYGRYLNVLTNYKPSTWNAAPNKFNHHVMSRRTKRCGPDSTSYRIAWVLVLRTDVGALQSSSKHLPTTVYIEDWQ